MRCRVGMETRRSSVRQSLLDREPGLREAIRDTSAGLAVAIQEIAFRLAPLDVCRDRVGNLLAIMRHVDDVVAPFAPHLAGADVHRRNAQVRTLTNRDARVADDRG